MVLDVPVRLPQNSPLSPDGGAATSMVQTRVPDDGTVLSFSLVGGFRPFTFGLAVDVFSAQLPRTIITAPDGEAMYVVDEGRQSNSSGLRGQVLRFYAQNQSTDPTFVIR